MKILLDTCDFLWFISGDAALPDETRRQVQDGSNEVFLSVVSVWEIILKHALERPFDSAVSGDAAVRRRRFSRKVYRAP